MACYLLDPRDLVLGFERKDDWTALFSPVYEKPSLATRDSVAKTSLFKIIRCLAMMLGEPD
jgi:hypothetical protein